MCNSVHTTQINVIPSSTNGVEYNLMYSPPSIGEVLASSQIFPIDCGLILDEYQVINPEVGPVPYKSD